MASKRPAHDPDPRLADVGLSDDERDEALDILKEIREEAGVEPSPTTKRTKKKRTNKKDERD